MVAKKLYRSERDVKIGGVCGGLAEYFDIDPSIIRIVWAAWVLFGGTGLIAYIIAWIVLPKRPMI